MNIKETIRAKIERRKKENMYVDLPMSIGRYYEDRDLLAFLDTIPEQPVEGLEEAANEFANQDCVTFISRKKGFIAGAEWQREQMMDEWLKDRDGCFWDGVEEGKKAMEKQMMEEAVEANLLSIEVSEPGIAHYTFEGKKVPAAFTGRYFGYKIIVIKDEK